MIHKSELCRHFVYIVSEHVWTVHEVMCVECSRWNRFAAGRMSWSPKMLHLVPRCDNVHTVNMFFRLFGICGSISVSDGVHELLIGLIRQSAKCSVVPAS